MAAEFLTIVIEENAPPDVQTSIESLLNEEANDFGYPFRVRQFCAVLRSPNGGLEGGINARCYWEWLRVDSLVVAPRWRGRGYGRHLLAQAETWGRNCSCHDAWLTTMGDDARRFYERAGYSTFAELPNFPGTLTRLFMRKSLVNTPQ
jgi:GNAT superfamily N-acetyltransferase